MRKRNHYWSFLGFGVLAGVILLIILFIGQPWKRLFPEWEWSRTGECTSAVSGPRESTEIEPLLYDTEYGNIGVGEEVSQVSRMFVTDLYSTSFRAIAADYECFSSGVKSQLSPVFTFPYQGEKLSADDFLKQHAQEMISGRIEWKCSFTPEYEVLETSTTAYVNGTLSVTVYSAKNLSYLKRFLEIPDLETGVTNEVPFGMYLICDGASGEWIVQEIKNGYYTF